MCECQGEKIEMANLRTKEQKQMMEMMGPLIWEQMSKGATPFGGQLTQGPDPGMLQAMNMMSQVGGQGPYQVPGMQTGAYPPPPGMGDIPPWNYSWQDQSNWSEERKERDPDVTYKRGRLPEDWKPKKEGIKKKKADPYAAY